MAFQTTLNLDELRSQAEALGLDRDAGGSLVCAAIVADAEFREQVSRFFGRAMIAVRAADGFIDCGELPPQDELPIMLRRQAE